MRCAMEMSERKLTRELLRALGGSLVAVGAAMGLLVNGVELQKENVSVRSLEVEEDRRFFRPGRFQDWKALSKAKT